MKLQAGHFYKSKAGDVWCCYLVNPDAEEHARAYCIASLVRTGRVGEQSVYTPSTRTEYFFLDGRYDAMGTTEHCLIEECGPDGGLVRSSGLNTLRDVALKIAREHGFVDASVPEDIALFHSEATELLEDFRDGRLMHEVHYVEKVTVYDSGGQPIRDDFGKLVTTEIPRKGSSNLDGSTRKPCGPPSELADIIIRVLHFCGKHGVDIESAVEEKLVYNNSRPFKHGGKKI